MKKIFKSRGFTIAALSTLCICIAGICWYVNRGRPETFLPEESLSAAASSEWLESSTAVETESKPEETKRVTASKQETTAAETENYPKVVAESSGEAEISFTPTQKPTETAPPAPEGKTILEDPGPEHPVNPAPEVTTAAAEPPAPTEPEAGSATQDGAIYDPVFGWVVPSEVIQSTIDSDGDPNKMVGNMD